MQKNNIKSFVCSFIFSVLAVIAVQKVFFRTPEIKKNDTPTDTKIENISLFSEDAVDSDISPFVASLETPVVDTSDIDSLVTAQADTVIEEQFLPVEQPAINEVIPQIQQTDQIALPKKQTVSTDLAYSSEITLDDDEIEEIKENQKHLQSGIVYADISDTLSEMPQSAQENTPFEIADNDVSDEDIPLFENSDVLHEKINVSNNADTSKIAMLDPDTLINSIEQTDVMTQENNLAEADLKKNEVGALLELSNIDEPEIDETAWAKAEASSESGEIQSALQNSAQDEDNPWVMAKGNKYAKNRVVVEEFNEKEEQQTEVSTETDEVQTPDEPQASDEPEIIPSSQENQIKENQESLEDTQQTKTLSLIDTDDDRQNLSQTFSEPLLKQKTTDTKLAYQMIQNILIPIPQDILNDADLTPDLTSSPEEREISSNIKTDNLKPTLSGKDKETGLFKSISSWFSKEKVADGIEKAQDTLSAAGSSVKQTVYSALGKVEDYNPATGSIMPAELRLSFQPNRAEISGQTLKWIYAFADNARDNNDVYIEVRIDGTSSYVLQQKRLNLLSSIFASRGVDWRKINTIFTSREPNSFIIRNIRFNNKEKEDQNLR